MARCARLIEASPKRKRTNFRWPSIGINSPANRPDPDGPGGLGAEESGTERTGPTQDCLVASQRGGRWAEVGQQYDSANVPVSPFPAPGSGRPDNPSRGAVFAK